MWPACSLLCSRSPKCAAPSTTRPWNYGRRNNYKSSLKKPGTFAFHFKKAEPTAAQFATALASPQNLPFELERLETASAILQTSGCMYSSQLLVCHPHGSHEDLPHC